MTKEDNCAEESKDHLDLSTTTGARQEPMSRSMKLHYISVTAFHRPIYF